MSVSPKIQRDMGCEYLSSKNYCYLKFGLGAIMRLSAATANIPDQRTRNVPGRTILGP